MLLTGIAFILFAVLIQFANFSVVASGIVVGVGLILVAFLLGERFPTRSP